MSTFVLDSSACISFFRHEKDWRKVEKILQCVPTKTNKVYINIIALGEVYYKILKEKGKQEAEYDLDLIKNWPVVIVNVNEEMIKIAANFKLSGLSYIDSLIAATAMQQKATLVTANYDFKILEKKIKIIWI